MNPIRKTVIKNNYTYQGLRKEMKDDGYIREYSITHYFFGLKIHEHTLNEKIYINTPDTKELGF